MTQRWKDKSVNEGCWECEYYVKRCGIVKRVLGCVNRMWIGCGRIVMMLLILQF